MTLLVFTRSGMGVWGVGYYGVWSLVLILFYGLMMNSAAMIFIYLPAWLLLAIRQKIFPDRIQHSRYTGFPWAFDGIIANEYLARFVEAVTMLFIGNLLCGIAPEVGLFVMGGCASLGVKASLDYALHRRRVQASRDWRAEADAWQRAMEEAERRFR
jgi:hypothetical protein